MDELPEPSPELILLSAFAQAYVQGLSAKERERFLKRAADLLDQFHEMDNIRRLKARMKDADLAAAVSGADAWFKQALPLFLGAGVKR